MRGEGYARQTREVQIRLVADFGRWLAKRGILAQKITPELFPPYLRARARRRRPTRNDLSALQRLWDLLVRQGVVSPPVSPVATAAERLQSEFRLYLQQERALASTTQNCYLTFVSDFLTERFGTGRVDLSGLCAADVTGFVRRRAVTIRSKRVQLMTTALRSFLRFARYRGDIDKDLAACVPAVANWKLSTIPRALPPRQVELVLDSIDRKTAMGRRDYAILLILARLGLRAGEIKALTLEDLDWREGLITVRGKAGRYSQLPLPAEVGEAIAEYLQDGRRTASSRCVFLRTRAPIGGFKGQWGIGSIVKHALARAGIDSPRKGAHQFRHGLASQMLRRGASLFEIGELLRHRSPQTTAIYAKVDLASLSTLALPWPGGAR
jgi:site-specific recombinase XerD